MATSSFLSEKDYEGLISYFISKGLIDSNQHVNLKIVYKSFTMMFCMKKTEIDYQKIIKDIQRFFKLQGSDYIIYYGEKIVNNKDDFFEIILVNNEVELVIKSLSD